MKRLLFILIVLSLCLTGCAKDENANAKWDCVEYETIEELNQAAGTNIVTAAVSGKSDEWFGLISNSIAQYKFKVNDEDWCIRASKDVDNDISGLNYDSIGFEKDMDSFYYNDEVYAERFFYDNVQYVISLVVKDKDIARSYFDSVCGELHTNITGVKAGYENEIFEDGDDVVYRVVLFNDDATTTTMEIIYTFDGDKMVKITSSMIFETEEALQNYLKELVEYGNSIDDIVVDGTTMTLDSSSNVDFYSDYTKAQFIEMMKNSMAQ